MRSTASHYSQNVSAMGRRFIWNAYDEGARARPRCQAPRLPSRLRDSCSVSSTARRPKQNRRDPVMRDRGGSDFRFRKRTPSANLFQNRVLHAVGDRGVSERFHHAAGSAGGHRSQLGCVAEQFAQRDFGLDDARVPRCSLLMIMLRRSVFHDPSLRKESIDLATMQASHERHRV